MDELRKKALNHGATEFGISKVKNKRFYVIYNGRRINFGLKNGSTFIDHKDTKKRENWRARHSKIMLKDGTPAYKNKNHSAYWSYKILW